MRARGIVIGIITAILLMSGCGDSEINKEDKFESGETQSLNSQSEDTQEQVTENISDEDLMTQLFSEENNTSDKNKDNRSYSDTSYMKDVILEDLSTMTGIKDISDKDTNNIKTLASLLKEKGTVKRRTRYDRDIYLVSKYNDGYLAGIFYLKKYTFKNKNYDDYILAFILSFDDNGRINDIKFGEGFYRQDIEKQIDKPTLNYPVNNETIDQENAQFSWNNVDHATSYRFLLSTRSDFSNFSDSANGGNNTCLDNGCFTVTTTYNSYTKDRLYKAGTTYYWKVRAYDANSKVASAWSKVGVFKSKGVALAGSNSTHRLTNESFNSGFYREVKKDGEYVNGLWYRGYAPKRFYDYSKGQYSELKSWAKGNCTWYAKARARQMGGIVSYKSWGNAKTFDDYARKEGIIVNNIPSVGAIAQTDAGTYGHVAVVERVLGNGYIEISESSYSSIPEWNFEYRYRKVKATAFRYIHVER